MGAVSGAESREKRTSKSTPPWVSMAAAEVRRAAVEKRVLVSIFGNLKNVEWRANDRTFIYCYSLCY